MSEREWCRALEWLDAWSQGVAAVNPMTAPERQGFMDTLREIKALPTACVCGHTAHWHADGGSGDCEHDGDCGCVRFREKAA